MAAGLAGGLVFSANLWAAPPQNGAVSGNPYSPIIDRNVFGLLTPPPPVDNAAALLEANLPKITVNGISVDLGNVEVLFKTSGKQGSKDSYYDLAAGESEDNIEVVRIDQSGGMVTFENNGVQQQIPLAEVPHGSGGGGGNPGVIIRGGSPFPGGRFGGGGFNPNSPGGIRPGGFNGQQANHGNNGGGNGGGDQANANNMGLNFGQHVDPSAPPSPAFFSQLTAEQQAVLLEVNRVATQEQVDQGKMPPLLPTPITPADATGIGGAPLVAPPPVP